ncbi:MAG TPA: hypothetical protein VKR32_07465 [Puia sp.]|nr:hypothetical protein [Puia sp.]
MEVHHHPDIDHKSKRFKEYFLEFLMIFLAVTLGFFAENVREWLTENAKEKEYMGALVEDLKADTAQMASTIADWKESNLNLDSILIFLKKELDTSTIRHLYLLFSEDYWHFDLFKYNNKTIEELKSSGNYRLIRKKPIANQIITYDLDMKYILIQEQDVKELMISSKNVESKIFDFSQFMWTAPRTTGLLFINSDQKPHHLLSYDKQLIGEYFNKLLSFRFLAYSHVKRFEKTKEESTKLLTIIQREYHLANE